MSMFSSLVLLNDPVIFSFTLGNLLYLIIAIIIAAVAETIIGWRLPLGILGAILCASLGIALFVIIPIHIGNDLQIFGLNIAVAKAFIGGAVLITIWHLVTYSQWSRRHRYYRGRREEVRDEPFVR